MIDRARLTEIYARECQAFVARHPRSAAAYRRSDHLFGRVPMTWMNKSVGGFPTYLERARPLGQDSLEKSVWARPPRDQCAAELPGVVSGEKRRSRRLLLTTNTELKAMAAPAMRGLSRPSAASGMAAML